MNFNLTRIAPTPSGYLHLGNLYSFLVTKALAAKHHSKILLRIDDLDRERTRTEYIQDIFDTLDFMEISYDLGPKNSKEFISDWSQTLRIEMYQKALEELAQNSLLFGCTCSRKKIKQFNPPGCYLGHCLDRKIPLDKKEVAWRLDTFSNKEISIINYPKAEKEDFLPKESAFFVVRKKDGIPSYQLASLLDDVHFKVDLIVRGKDLYHSSLSQLSLASHLEDSVSFQKSTFYHHPILLDSEKEKLSKTEGAISIQHLRSLGKTKKDILLRLSQRLGWENMIDNLPEFEHELLKKIATP